MAMSKRLTDSEFNDRREDVYDVLADEILYTRNQWDPKRSAKNKGGSQQPDAEKSVEFWILLMEQLTADARAASLGSMDKTAALDLIRQVGGVAVTCMIHNPPPHREL